MSYSQIDNDFRCDFHYLLFVYIKSLIEHSKINPCRCDCVLKEKNISNDSTKTVFYTVFFTDGKTKCGNRKVSSLKKRQ
jgi:hypothetical protein